MSSYVWVSHAGNNRYRHFDFGLPHTMTLEERVAMSDSIDLNSRLGLSQPSDRFPNILESVGKGSKLPSVLPDYINWVCPVVSEKLADVLQTCDLGGSNFYPVSLTRRDTGATFSQMFFILNIAVCKRALQPDRSSGLRERIMAPTVQQREFNLKTMVANDDLALSSCCLDGPDIWIDPMLPQETFFVSDRLYQSLESEKLSKPLDFVRCRVSD